MFKATKKDKGSLKDSKKAFYRECFYYKKKGHRAADCRKKKREQGENKPDSGASTGPLPTPSGGRGLSPPLAKP